MKRAFKTLLSSLLITGIIVGSAFSALPAPTLAATEAVVNGPNGQPVNAQSAAYVQGINNGQGTQQSSNVANLAGRGVACSAGQILANLLISAVSSGVQGVTSAVGVSHPADAISVPIVVKGDIADQLNAQTNSTVGQFKVGIPLQPSWDSIAWCIVNTIIEYIIDSTIQWAKTGFNGNPAFITNPDEFFRGLADQEAGAFIQQVAKSELGINVCQPFRVQISLGLAQSYGNTGGQRLSCTIESIVRNYNGFVNGNFNEGGWTGWFAMTQSDPNNWIGARQIANDQMYARISARNNTANLELGWNKGFLSFQHCTDKSDPKTCQIDTPGTLIQSSLEKSLNLPKDRLIVAQKFDQLVTTLVNSLIQVALNKVLTSNK